MRGPNPINTRALEAVVEFWRQNLGITNIEFQAQPEAFVIQTVEMIGR